MIALNQNDVRDAQANEAQNPGIVLLGYSFPAQGQTGLSLRSSLILSSPTPASAELPNSELPEHSLPVPRLTPIVT